MILGFIGTTELMLIGGLALLLVGGKKLPEMMRGLGRGVREFKEGMKDHGGSNQDEARESIIPEDTEAVVSSSKDSLPKEPR